MNIGERIKSLRKDSGLTQKQLGEKIGISEFSVRKYESGDRKPSATTLKVIANIFNMTDKDLLNDVSEYDKNEILDNPHSFYYVSFYEQLRRYAESTNNNFSIEIVDEMLVIKGDKVNNNSDPYSYTLSPKEQKILFDRILDEAKKQINISLYEYLISAENKEGE